MSKVHYAYGGTNNIHYSCEDAPEFTPIVRERIDFALIVRGMVDGSWLHNPEIRIRPMSDPTGGFIGDWVFITHHTQPVMGATFLEVLDLLINPYEGAFKVKVISEFFKRHERLMRVVETLRDMGMGSDFRSMAKLYWHLAPEVNLNVSPETTVRLVVRETIGAVSAAVQVHVSRIPPLEDPLHYRDSAIIHDHIQKLQSRIFEVYGRHP